MVSAGFTAISTGECLIQRPICYVIFAILSSPA
jgi:hypothetical protein